MLHGIRLVKLTGWGSIFAERIDAVREEQLNAEKQYLLFDIFLRLVVKVVPELMMAVMFLTYTALLGHELTASTAFTALALGNTLRDCFIYFPMTIQFVQHAQVSYRRVNAYLRECELDKLQHRRGACAHNDSRVAKDDVGFSNASIEWRSEEGNDAQDSQGEHADATTAATRLFSMQGLDFVFPRGKLSVVVGPTGAGKSSLLMSLIGGTHCTANQWPGCTAG